MSCTNQCVNCSMPFECTQYDNFRCDFCEQIDNEITDSGLENLWQICYNSIYLNIQKYYQTNDEEAKLKAEVWQNRQSYIDHKNKRGFPNEA